MFSCASLSKSSSQLSPSSVTRFRRSARSFLQSNASPSSSPPSVAAFCPFSGGSDNYGQNQEGGALFQLLSSISSGVVVATASLGFCYCSGSFLGLNSFVALADSDKGAALAAEADQIRQSIPHKKPRFLFGESYRRRVFFNYEKRIRTQSPPEKVFEYFASQKTAGGEVLMTPADLMRAIVPVFPPSQSDYVRAGSLRGEKSLGELHCPPSEFFMLFDTNNDGLISFPEYMFFVTLLKIPESSFSVAFKMFDLNNDGEIDRQEFKKVMGLMRAQSRQAATHRDGRKLGFKTEPVDEGGLLEHFFGKDGNARLKHQKFVQFLRDLQDEILKLEFAHYDLKSNGTISGKDFALSLVAAADIGDVNKLFDLVEELDDEPRIRDVRISFKEFKNFAELRRELQSFSLAIISYGRANGTLTKKDFQRAASQVCGIDITDNVIDIVFHLFDANRDGSLSSDEFVRVLERRVGDDSRTRDPGTNGLISCLFNCAANCSSSKLF